MGVPTFGSSCRSSGHKKKHSGNGNPNPNNFKILKRIENENFIILEVHYPDCKNFEGIKILVYKVESSQELGRMIRLKELDPHFCDKHASSLVARFAPTNEGRNLALQFINKVKPIL